MQQSRIRSITGPAAGLILGLGIAATACATDATATLAPTQPITPVATMPVETPRQIDGLGAAVDHQALARFRGGEADVDQEVDIRGQVDGNSATDVVSGGNTISGGAFGNAAGINTVIQNSGSNVLIQNGMNVHVQFVDPTP